MKTVSASNPEGVWDLGNGFKKPMIGKIQVREGVSVPGLLPFLWAMAIGGYGAQTVSIDGVTIPGGMAAGERASMPMPPCAWIPI